jgi:hypothetical protein
MPCLSVVPDSVGKLRDDTSYTLSTPSKPSSQSRDFMLQRFSPARVESARPTACANGCRTSGAAYHKPSRPAAQPGHQIRPLSSSAARQSPSPGRVRTASRRNITYHAYRRRRRPEGAWSPESLRFSRCVGRVAATGCFRPLRSSPARGQLPVCQPAEMLEDGCTNSAAVHFEGDLRGDLGSFPSSIWDPHAGPVIGGSEKRVT